MANTTKILIDFSYPTLDHVSNDCSYVIINVTWLCLMIWEIIMSDMAFDVSEYLFCNIDEKLYIMENGSRYVQHL